MTLCKAKLECTSKEPTILHPQLEPWKWSSPDVEFNTTLDGCMGKNDAAENINNAAQRLLDKISEADIVCYTDGSAHEGTKNGGAGATVEIPGSDKITIKYPCGIICSSYRAEMIAIERALQAVKDNLDYELLSSIEDSG